MKHIEPLHRGLVTNRDASLLNEGELTRVQNLRYKPGNPALVRAEGRIQIGGGPYIDNHPLRAFGIAWDNRPPQLWFINDVDQLKFVEVAADPADPQMAPGNARTPIAEPGAIIPAQQYEPIHFEGRYALLTGLNPLQLQIEETNPGFETLRVLGMRRNDLAVQVAHVNAAGFFPAGWYHYWFTWYASSTGQEREGTTSVDAVGRIHVDSSKNNFRLFIPKHTFDYNKPTWADKIRIYRAPTQSNELPSPWPIGYRVAEVAISALVAVSGASLIAAGLVGSEVPISTSVQYYPLLTDTAAFNLNSLPAFEIFTVVIDGKPVSIGRDGEPPICDTGDVFEDSLCVNDIQDKRKMRYSLSGQYGKFPDLQFVNFDSRDWDEIITIRTLGRALGVFMRSAVWRVNWLPRSGADEFGRGRVKELVAEGFGTFGKRLVVDFQSPTGPLLAWIGPTKVPYGTDLNDFSELAPQVDWQFVSGIPIALLNNIFEYRLEYYFTDPSGGFVYYLHYHPTQVTNGQLAVTGPHTRTAGISNAITIRTSERLQNVSFDYRGNAFYESLGVTEDGKFLPIAFETRELYLAGAGDEFKVSSLLVHATTPPGEWSYQLIGLPPGGVKEGKLMGPERLRIPNAPVNAEYAKILITEVLSSDSVAQIDWVGLEWESLGEVER